MFSLMLERPVWNPQNRKCVNFTWTRGVFSKLREFKLPSGNQLLLVSEETLVNIGTEIIKDASEFGRHQIKITYK